jgi:hypothetical protein
LLGLAFWTHRFPHFVLFSFLSYRDEQTDRRPGSRDGSAREDGSRTEAVWGISSLSGSIAVFGL